MWLTSWYSLLLTVIVMMADAYLRVGNPVPLFGVEYARSTYFDYWTPLWHLAVVAATGVVAFWLLFESTEEDYVEYLFADYAVAIGSESNTVSLGENAEIAVSGEIHTTLENDLASDKKTADSEDEVGTDSNKESDQTD